MANSKGPDYRYVGGFGSLSSFIAADEDRSGAIYRRFDWLATRDLHYYQSELAELEAQQREYDIEDAQLLVGDGWGEIRERNQNWQIFETTVCTSPSSTVPAGPAVASNLASTSTSASVSSANGSSNGCSDEDRRKVRHDLAMRIRKTLREYREALLLDTQLLSMQHPSEQAMNASANYYHNHNSDSPDEDYPTLTGASAQLYPRALTSSQLRRSDIITLSPQSSLDRLSRFLKTYCWRLFHTDPGPVLPIYEKDVPTITHLQPSQVFNYSSRYLHLTTSTITTILAALLLFLPIYTLYKVSSSSRAELTLGLIALFALVFAAAIRLTTQARPVEVFGACAAYAAVLVVFISSDFVGGGDPEG